MSAPALKLGAHVRLTTPRLRVTTLGPEDAPRVARFYQDNAEHLAPWAPPRPEDFATEDFWALRLLQAQREKDSDTGVHFFAVDRGAPNGPVVASVTLSQIIRGPLQAAFLGYDLDARRQGEGLMTEAASAVVDWAFCVLKLHRLNAGYVPDNTRSARVLSRLGFTVEGLQRSSLFVGGRWQDHVLTGRINPLDLPREA